MITVPRMSPEILAEVHKRLDAFIAEVYSTGFTQGYERGDQDALARVLKAARSPTNGHQFVSATSGDGDSAGRGADTHKLIETALRAAPANKATPMEITKSPLNKAGIKRDAIRNALRRGAATGRYASDGKGRYLMGKAEGHK